MVLFAWTVFEAVKHAGLTVPLAAAGFAVPLLSKLLPGRPVVRQVLPRVWVPLAAVVVCAAIPGPAEDTAAPFTFGMAWLTHLALRHAVGRAGVGGR
ncbi:hypothetical protein [Kitasatospora sp. NPDC056531]|uniref:hypothetical protein n=1 Tax=Kitasatospora sp. NPDC056531 TaxID=3345856 RepID=UPI00367AB21A